MGLTGTELTEAQEAVAGWPGGRLAVIGAAGTGKTTALVERYLRLVGAGAAPSRVLVAARDRGAAGRFVDACLPRLAGSFDALPITTFAGVAFDVLRRAGIERRLIPAPERWALVRQLLAEEAASPDAAVHWPRAHQYLGRTALVDEVAGSLARMPDAGTPGELLDFADRYRSALEARGLIDFPTLLLLAAGLDADVGGSYDHVLADDFEAVTAPAAELLDRIAHGSASAVVAGNPDAAVGSQQGADPCHLANVAAAGTRLDLPVRLRRSPAVSLSRSHHPALEPEAVAAELARAASEGVPWSRMAVLVRRPGTRGGTLSRTLARHGIPAAAGPTTAADEPVVAGLLDLLRWADGDESAPSRLLASALSGLAPADVDRVRRDARAANVQLADDPHLAGLRQLRDDLAARADRDDVAALAHRAFRGSLAGLVSDAADPAGAPDPETARALDAAVAFVGELDAFVGQRPGARLRDYLTTLDAPDAELEPWQPSLASSASSGSDAVTVTSLAAAAGREWDVVVVAGCVEGELPRWPRTGGLFAHLRDDPLAEERRLFGLAAGAATTRVVATAGPEPGQLVSRFVADWPAAAGGERPIRAQVAAVAPLAETTGDAPVWPDGLLRLSATQLTTYEDCPLKYAFAYALRIRDEGNVWAAMGSLFHAIVADFLRPEAGQSGDPDDRSWERLLRIAESHWTDEVATYRPQRDEVRRLLYEMLDGWYNTEIAPAGGPDVVDVERQFRFEVGPHAVTGSIDRVDRVPAGIEIVDYKTGRSMPKPDEVADDLQLAVYHLAASRDPELAALGPPRRLTLRYVRTGKDADQPVTSDHAQRTEARILALAGEIVAETYSPSLDADCRNCHFHRLCPMQPAGREVGST